jgi:hypothetical protein
MGTGTMYLSKYVSEIYTISFYHNGVKAVIGEIKEVYEAAHMGDWKGMWYEITQVILYIIILLHYSYKLDILLPKWLPWEEDYKRLRIWKRILKKVGYTGSINNEWFNRGNNWKRPDKIVYVLSKAGYGITEEMAQKIIMEAADTPFLN